MRNNTKPGFLHNVYFWFKDNLSSAERKGVVDGINSLSTISTIWSYYSGEPANTPRDVVDSSYDYSISVYFANKADHDAYQIDPIHRLMVEQFAHCWERVQVYDTAVDQDN